MKKRQTTSRKMGKRPKQALAKENIQNGQWTTEKVLNLYSNQWNANEKPLIEWLE